MKVFKVNVAIVAILFIVATSCVSSSTQKAVTSAREKELMEFSQYQKRAKTKPSIEDPSFISFKSQYDSIKVYNAKEFTTDGNNKTTFIMGGTTFIRNITVFEDDVAIKTYQFKGCAVFYDAVAFNRRDYKIDEGYREYIPELNDLVHKQKLIKWFSNANNCLYGEKYMAKYVRNSSEILIHLGLIK